MLVEFFNRVQVMVTTYTNPRSGVTATSKLQHSVESELKKMRTCGRSYFFNAHEVEHRVEQVNWKSRACRKECELRALERNSWT